MKKLACQCDAHGRTEAASRSMRLQGSDPAARLLLALCRHLQPPPPPHHHIVSLAAASQVHSSLDLRELTQGSACSDSNMHGGVWCGSF